MKIQQKKNSRQRLLSALVVLAVGLSAVPVAQSKAGSYVNESKINSPDRIQEAKPVAGRNRQRIKSRVTLTKYPQANADSVRVSRKLDKLRINLLSNDRGHKLRLVNINSRSAKGAQVSIRHGMAVYQLPHRYVGEDTFWYTMEDVAGRQHSAKVIVCICDK